MEIPVLLTDRLRLRGFTAADFPAFAALWADPAVVRHILPAPRDAAASWRAFLLNAGSWAICGYGEWAVCRRDTGAVIGLAGFFNAGRGLGADVDALPECGWMLMPSAWGQGFASEAARAAHRWFDASGHGPASVALIETGHSGSERIAAALGYQPLRSPAMEGPPVTLYRRG